MCAASCANSRADGAGVGEAGVEHIVDGLACRVVKGTHAGKTGTVEDRKVSKTGQVTITVRQPDGERIKTLARNVVPDQLAEGHAPP